MNNLRTKKAGKFRPSINEPLSHNHSYAKGGPRVSTWALKWLRRYLGAGYVIGVLLVGGMQAQDFTYTNTNGTITITSYIGPGGNVAIPAIIDELPVRILGGVAFIGNTKVTAVTIPDTVTNIADGLAFMAAASGAFWRCSALTNVVIGNGVVYIGAATFGACTNLTRVSIPESVTMLSMLAFDYCQSLTTVTFLGSRIIIGDYAFAECPNLRGVYFKGDAPPTNAGQTRVFDGSPVTVYYLPGTSGWGPTFLGRPTKLWNPQAQTADGSFGVRQNQFGFNIAGTADIPLVVEASANLATASWIPLQTCTLTNGLLYFSDPQWKDYSERVYRIRSP